MTSWLSNVARTLHRALLRMVSITKCSDLLIVRFVYSSTMAMFFSLSTVSTEQALVFVVRSTLSHSVVSWKKMSHQISLIQWCSSNNPPPNSSKRLALPAVGVQVPKRKQVKNVESDDGIARFWHCLEVQKNDFDKHFTFRIKYYFRKVNKTFLDAHFITDISVLSPGVFCNGQESYNWLGLSTIQCSFLLSYLFSITRFFSL